MEWELFQKLLHTKSADLPKLRARLERRHKKDKGEITVTPTKEDKIVIKELILEGREPTGINLNSKLTIMNIHDNQELEKEE